MTQVLPEPVTPNSSAARASPASASPDRMRTASDCSSLSENGVRSPASPSGDVSGCSASTRRTSLRSSPFCTSARKTAAVTPACCLRADAGIGSVASSRTSNTVRWAADAMRPAPFSTASAARISSAGRASTKKLSCRSSGSRTASSRSTSPRSVSISSTAAARVPKRVRNACADTLPRVRMYS